MVGPLSAVFWSIMIPLVKLIVCDDRVGEQQQNSNNKNKNVTEGIVSKNPKTTHPNIYYTTGRDPEKRVRRIQDDDDIRTGKWNTNRPIIY